MDKSLTKRQGQSFIKNDLGQLLYERPRYMGKFSKKKSPKRESLTKRRRRSATKKKKD